MKIFFFDRKIMKILSLKNASSHKIVVQETTEVSCFPANKTAFDVRKTLYGLSQSFCVVFEKNRCFFSTLFFFKKNNVDCQKTKKIHRLFTKIFKVQNLKSTNAYDSLTNSLCSTQKYYRMHKRQPLGAFLSRRKLKKRKKSCNFRRSKR